MNTDRMMKNMCAFCQVPSVSHTQGERLFTPVLRDTLFEMNYFRSHTQAISIMPVSADEEDSTLLFALMRAPKQPRETILLLSHYDVVGVEEYGVLRSLAFTPSEYTKMLKAGAMHLDSEAKADLDSGNYLFGRGVCDMKWGIALDVELLHYFDAHAEEMQANLLLVCVPDEERNSTGMLSAVPKLVEYAKEHDLSITSCIVSEPNISPERSDHIRSMHVGAAGKIMPSFFCYGRETHVGEPFAGLDANLLTSEIVRRFELSSDFIDEGDGFFTPAPTCLKQSDLKEAYSVKTPGEAVCYFNVITATSTPEETIAKMETLAASAFEAVLKNIKEKHAACEQKLRRPLPLTSFEPKVIRYDDLYRACLDVHGDDFRKAIASFIGENRHLDMRDLSIQTVKRVHDFYPDRSPLIVLFFCPPFYPHAIRGKGDSITLRACEKLTEHAKCFGETLVIDECFMGLTDMSYLSLTADIDPAQLGTCYPIWGSVYTLPLEQMRELNVPFVNFGPLGKDPHRYTERVDLDYSFTKAPLLALTLTKLLMAEK